VKPFASVQFSLRSSLENSISKIDVDWFFTLKEWGAYHYKIHSNNHRTSIPIFDRFVMKPSKVLLAKGSLRKNVNCQRYSIHRLELPCQCLTNFPIPWINLCHKPDLRPSVCLKETSNLEITSDVLGNPNHMFEYSIVPQWIQKPPETQGYMHLHFII